MKRSGALRALATALIAAFLIVLSRVQAGAHYLRDVIVGMMIGIGAGQLFWVI